MAHETGSIEKIVITPDERERIRGRLEAYRSGDGRRSKPISPEYISERMSDIKYQVGGTVSAETIRRFLDTREESVVVRDIHVALIGRFLESIEEGVGLITRAPLGQPTASASARLFPSLQLFFGMRPEKASQFRAATSGVWRFYAYSERNDNRVCRGAIRFEVAVDGDMNADELQRSTPETTEEPYEERHEGKFIFRKNVMIVTLRLLGNSALLPKFYILSIEPFLNKDGKHRVMTGSVLKIGAQNDVAFGRIHMVRDDSAFEKCDVLDVEHPDVKPIVPILDSVDKAAKLLGGARPSWFDALTK